MAKDKEYMGKALVENSRWRDHLPTLSADQLDGIVARVNELIADNPEYCDDGNYDHMSNLCTGLALYEMHLSEGRTEQEAYELSGQPMWDYVEEHTAGMYRKLFSKSPVFGLMGSMLPRMFEAGSGYGWEYRWHDDPKGRISFECVHCIYAQILEKYGMREMGTMFCHADDINYGSIPTVEFRREHTLCQDGQECDFLFLKSGKGSRMA